MKFEHLIFEFHGSSFSQRCTQTLWRRLFNPAAPQQHLGTMNFSS